SSSSPTVATPRPRGQSPLEGWEKLSTEEVLRLRARRELLESLTRCVARRDADKVTTQQEVHDPVAENADLALPHGHRETVVAAVHDPRDEALDGELAVLVDAPVEPDARDGAEV